MQVEWSRAAITAQLYAARVTETLTTSRSVASPSAPPKATVPALQRLTAWAAEECHPSERTALGFVPPLKSVERSEKGAVFEHCRNGAFGEAVGADDRGDHPHGVGDGSGRDRISAAVRLRSIPIRPVEWHDRPELVEALDHAIRCVAVDRVWHLEHGLLDSVDDGRVDLLAAVPVHVFGLLLELRN